MYKIMAYYLNLFSPETYEAFSKSDRTISGFRETQRSQAEKINEGDIFICYMTKMSRWIGALEIVDGPFINDTPIFYEEDDPFKVKFKVKPIYWFPVNKCIPIYKDKIWDKLSFTKNENKNSSTWTGPIRSSLRRMEVENAEYLMDTFNEIQDKNLTFDFNENKYQKYLPKRIRRTDRFVKVTVPEDEKEHEQKEELDIRESFKVQALLAELGEKMGFKVWLPKSDRGRVTQAWKPIEDSLLEILPLNYDEVTLQTIEQIDVIWLKGRSIRRAFEVEHTTSIYSGILRMADLLALQPNMDINLHIVAPEERKEKVFQEIQRPVFSLIEKGALSDYCTYLSYNALEELGEMEHVSHLSDSVLHEFEENAD